MHMHWGEYLFSFHGRVNRAKWWLFLLISIIYSFIAFTLCIAIFGFVGILVGWVLTLLLLWPSFAVGVKRLHDRAKSGWWLVLFYLMPGVLSGFNMSMTGGMNVMSSPGTMPIIFSFISLAITIWAIVELGVLRGTAGDNKYGPDPLAHAAVKAS
jgi:uncharacterized membrane protein YhaH (DUF805 family)